MPPPEVTRDYNQRDQIAIAARMMTVQQRAADGRTLEDGPFSLVEGVAERLRQQPDQLAQFWQTAADT